MVRRLSQSGFQRPTTSEELVGVLLDMVTNNEKRQDLSKWMKRCEKEKEVGDWRLCYAVPKPGSLSLVDEWEEPELLSQAFEARGFKKDIPYAVHIVWQTQRPEESTPVATPKMRKKARAVSPCPLKRELSSTNNSPHLNKREGAATTRALARLKEEEEDKKVKTLLAG